MSNPVAVGASGVPAKAGMVVVNDAMTQRTTTIEFFVRRECTCIKPRRVTHVNRLKRLKVCCELPTPMRIHCVRAHAGKWMTTRIGSRYCNVTTNLAQNVSCCSLGKQLRDADF